MNLFARLDWRHRCREWTCRHSGGGAGMNWEIRFEIRTLPCVKQVASGEVSHNIGSSALCSMMTER